MLIVTKIESSKHLGFDHSGITMFEIPPFCMLDLPPKWFQLFSRCSGELKNRSTSAALSAGPVSIPLQHCPHHPHYVHYSGRARHVA